jgi:hypothetical protein
MAYGVPGQLFKNEFGLKASVFWDAMTCSLLKVNWQALSIGVRATSFHVRF